MGTLDYIVLAVYLIAVLTIGLVLRSRGGGHREFFLAGRRMGWFPVGISVMVTVFSAINYVAFPNEVFSFGLYVTVALPVFFLAAWPVSRIWIPFFHRMELTSAYEYLGRRFDQRVRALASVFFIVWRIVWMAVALYAAGKFTAMLIGRPVPLVIVVAGVVATAYTFAGGMRAVMWTDVLQFFVLFGGIVLAVACVSGDGGASELFAIARDGGRLKPFVPFDSSFLSFSPTARITLWSGLIGVSVAFLARYGADQVVMQRYFSARSLKAAQRGIWFNATVAVVSLLLLVVLGLAIYAHAVQSGALDVELWQTMPAMKRKGMAMRQFVAVIRSLPAGLTGLVAAGLLAATMSSIDSGINACCAAVVSDLRSERPGDHGTRGVRGDRWLTACLGGLATLLALSLIPLTRGNSSLFMIVNKLINGLGSPLLTLFLLGMFCKRVNAPGVFWGGITGIAASVCISLFLNPLSLHYYAAANLVATMVPCLVFSGLAKVGGHRQPDETLQWTWRGNAE